MKLTPFIFLLCSFLLRGQLLAQQDSSAYSKFLEIEEDATKYSTLSMFDESVAKWTEAIEWAKEYGLKRQEINAKISLAEMLRKIGDYEQAFEILNSLDNINKYPDLQVRMLGRKAAIIHENSNDSSRTKIDTIKAYTLKALAMAKEHDLKPEEASLKNELGFLMIRTNQINKGLEYLYDASEIFYTLGDTLNYVFAMIHVADGHHQLEQTKKEDSIARSLTNLIKDTKWYAAKIDLYQIIAQSALKRNDSSKYYRFIQKKEAALVSHVKSINNNKLSALRVLYSTERYQQEAIKSENIANNKAIELQQQKTRTKALSIFSIILAIFILLAAFLFIRERRLKKQINDIVSRLKVANEEYEILMIESNHRIKNNLQMVISMLRYTKNDLETNPENYIERISSKIHTVSALHKHLYMDVHNERVSIQSYFQEVINLYQEIAGDKINIKHDIFPVKIKSERLVYFGLILNELLANSIEHNQDIKRTVNIFIAKTESKYYLEYFDNSTFNTSDSKGVGSGLINQLIKRVGGTDYEFTPLIGKYKFCFDE